jgi:hypothetical protein
MNDAKLREAYAALLRRPRDASRTGCPSPESLLELVERRGEEAARLATLDHAMSCEACRRELDLLRATVAAARPGRNAPSIRWAAAAVIVLAAGALWFTGGDRRSVMRGEVVETYRPAAAGPGARLAWRPVQDAVRYDVELLTASGDWVFNGGTADTMILVSGVERGRNYLWLVRATRRDGSRIASPAERFRLQE